MSSDYIPRLRRELLRAGATKPSRWAPAARTLRPLAAAAAVALVVLAVVLAYPRSDHQPSEQRADTVHLSYRTERSQAAPAARIMRERLAAAGIRGAGVSVSSTSGLTITAPASARAEVPALVRSGQLAIYDWERSVLGPRGNPAPDEVSVTGGVDAGRAAAITKAQAEERAARFPAGRAVRALGSVRDSWLAVGGPPALTNTEIRGARADVDPTTRDPIVVLELTADGQKAFSTLTRQIAHRGSANAQPGSGVETAQHLAIVVDGRILSMPFIDYRQAPNGIDAAAGVQIHGGLTPATARQLAVVLGAGPLPVVERGG
jgi:hypothetical protein